MASMRVISTSTIHASSTHNNDDDQVLEMHLTPWDLQLLLVDPIQKGLLFYNNNNDNPTPTTTIIQHLKASLSTTLSFFPPLAGRLAVTEHGDNTSSVSILCNNSGALFVHAVADNCSVGNILTPRYTPLFVHSFFPLNRVRNHQGTTKPLLAVQLTELVDGYFVGCTMNHVVGDGTSFWHFMNSWAEISRGLEKPSKPPALERWFLDADGLNNNVNGIRIPFTKEKQLQRGYDGFVSELQRERVFHFTKEKIAELKAKANSEVGNKEKNKISSLQAVLTHLWRYVVRNQSVDAECEVNYRLLIGARGRMQSPRTLPQNYFGNAVQDGTVTMKAGKLLEGGLGRAALEMNEMVGEHTEEKLKSHLRWWVKNPRLLTEGGMAGNALVTSSSPRFDVYGNDFGWGKPVAVRSGAGNKSHGKITVFSGVEVGSVDVEVCLSYEILEAMGNDSHFMDAVST